MVVAQLVERSLSIPEVRGSNPVIGKIYIEHLFTVNCIEKTKIRKRGREWPFFKKTTILRRLICRSVNATLEYYTPHWSSSNLLTYNTDRWSR